jgi:signal transduction histidine kinase
MPWGLTWRLVIAFALAIVCFCGSTLYSDLISRSIDEHALGIANESVPSIERLSAVRFEMRRQRQAVARYLETGNPGDREEALAARARLDDAFERYLALRTVSTSEQQLWRDLHHALSVMDRAVGEAMARVSAHQPVKYEEQVRPAMDAAADQLRAANDVDAAQARDLALRIESGRRRARRVSLLLDLLSTLFTALAALLTVRALTHHHRIVDERNQLVARRAEELEQFAGRVAHDVLGPLSATRLAVAHALGQSGDATNRRMLERGQRGIERVTLIVDGLLRFARAGARPEPGVMTMLAPSLATLVADLEPLAAQKSIALELTPVPPCSVFGNAGVLASVVENLVRNAIKYMGERSERRVIVSVQARAATVRIDVRDSGPGIAPSLLATLFDPHVRGRDTGQPGIGLGLATVKRIVEAHGGRVGVQSRPGDGSVFWCELPRADAVDDAPAPPAAHDLTA